MIIKLNLTRVLYFITIKIKHNTLINYFRALTGKYPPKIRMYSKYERRTDTRTYEDRRKLYEGVSIHFYDNYFILDIYYLRIAKSRSLFCNH